MNALRLSTRLAPRAVGLARNVKTNSSFGKLKKLNFKNSPPKTQIVFRLPIMKLRQSDQSAVSRSFEYRGYVEGKIVEKMKTRLDCRKCCCSRVFLWMWLGCCSWISLLLYIFVFFSNWKMQRYWRTAPSRPAPSLPPLLSSYSALSFFVTLQKCPTAQLNQFFFSSFSFEKRFLSSIWKWI